MLCWAAPVWKDALFGYVALWDAENEWIEMRLRALTGLERQRIQSEYDDLQERIGELREAVAAELTREPPRATSFPEDKRQSCRRSARAR